jgi:hypothetical protein
MIDFWHPTPRVGAWAAANNTELAYTPTNASWLNRIEAQFTALRYFTLDGTDHESHHAQASMIRRYIAWRTATPATAGSAKSSTGQTLPDAALERMERLRGVFGGQLPIPVGSASRSTVSQPARGASGRPCLSMLVMGNEPTGGVTTRPRDLPGYAQGLEPTAAVAGSIPAAPAG